MTTRIKTKKVGSIDLSTFGTRRQLDITFDEIDTIFKKTITRKAPVMDTAIITTPPEDITQDDEHTPLDEGKKKKKKKKKKVDLKKPYLGEHGELIWDQKSILPEAISDLTDQVRAIFSIKAEIERFTVRIYPPATKVDPKKLSKVDRVPEQAAMFVGARIIVPVGTPENLNLEVSMGGSSANSFIRLPKSNGLMTPIGLAAGTDFSWDDSSYGKLPQRKGHRVSTFKKSPLRRYMLVFDGINDMSVLMNTIKQTAKEKAGGDEAKEKELTESFMTAMNVSSDDNVTPSDAEATMSRVVNDMKSCHIIDEGEYTEEEKAEMLRELDPIVQKLPQGEVDEKQDDEEIEEIFTSGAN
jgi:hypothetical protein